MCMVIAVTCHRSSAVNVATVTAHVSVGLQIAMLACKNKAYIFCYAAVRRATCVTTSGRKLTTKDTTPLDLRCLASDIGSK